MKKLIYLISTLFFVVALAGHEAMARDTLTAKERETIEKAVKRELLDPESARFKWMRLPPGTSTKSSSITYCGLVNSKNSYGGYVGDRPFQVVIMWSEKGTLLSEIYVFIRDDTERTLKICADEGYSNLSAAE